MAQVFFSYSRLDSAVADVLAQQLDEAGIELWIDQREIRHHWDDEIEKAIEDCAALLVVLTPNSVASENVRNEISFAVGRGKPVIPAMLVTCKLPLRIHRVHYDDFTKDYKKALSSCCARLREILQRGGATVSTPAAKVPKAAKSKRVPVKEAPPPTKDGPVFRDFERAPEMIRIPPGDFLMGAAPDEHGATPDEKPRHKVVFPRAFAIGKWPVTCAEWAAALAESGVDRTPSDFGWGAGNRPVVDVSWDDAQTYTRWLSEKTGRRYRLPSEAEWEYAARAGTTSPFWWGGTITSGQANFDARYPYRTGEPGEYRRRTEPADAFRANPWGLYQVHGNVWEWCIDYWYDDHEGAPEDGSSRISPDARPAKGFFSFLKATPGRVVRGGSWKSVPNDLRAARRMSFPQTYRSNAIGFRVACELETRPRGKPSA